MQNKQLIWQFPNQKIPQIIHAVHVCQGRKKMDNKALFICVIGLVKNYNTVWSHNIKLPESHFLVYTL